MTFVCAPCAVDEDREWQNSANEWYYALFRQVPKITRDYVANRESDANNYFPVITQKFKNAIKGIDIDVLVKANEFAIGEINIDEQKGSIVFFSDGKLYSSVLKINQDGSIDKELFNQKLTTDNPVIQRLNQVKENDDKIMSYSNDKRRAKIVKNYQK